MTATVYMIESESLALRKSISRGSARFANDI